jgi:intracellular multiplication protein IcmE
MTDNLDDFDDDFADATVQQPSAQKPSMAGNLQAAWQGSPLFKMFILVVGVGAVAAAVIGILSGGDAAKKPTSTVTSAPNISAIPGTAAPPAYVDAVNEASANRAEQAIKQGTSALPTPISSDATTTGLGNENEESKYDPLAEFRPNVPQDTTVAQPAPAEPIETVDPDLMGRMQSQMTALFESWRPEGIRQMQVVDPASLVKDSSTQGSGLGSDKAAPVGKIIIPSGTINYAQLLVEANTDAPGPIMVEIMSGPFTGGRAIGAFEATREYLILHFTKISYKKKDYEVNAIALDPNTTLGGLVTEKDNRYFTRVVLPAGAAFLEAFGSALSSPNTTTTISNGNVIIAQESKQGVKDGLYAGLSEATQTVGGFFRDEAAATQPLIRVAPGTPMGLFFINAVTDGNPNPNVINTSTQSAGGGSDGGGVRPGLGRETPGATPLNLGGGVTIIPGSQSPLAGSGLNVIQSTPK